MALQNEFVNATTTAFLSNWLVDFLHWAQQRNQTVPQAASNCYNPMIGKPQGNLGQVPTIKTITGATHSRLGRAPAVCMVRLLPRLTRLARSVPRDRLRAGGQLLHASQPVDGHGQQRQRDPRRQHGQDRHMQAAADAHGLHGRR